MDENGRRPGWIPGGDAAAVGPVRPTLRASGADSQYLRGPIFEPLRSNPARVRAVTLEAGAGTISRLDGAVIDPDVLYHDLLPAWAGDDPRAAVGPVASGGSFPGSGTTGG